MSNSNSSGRIFDKRPIRVNIEAPQYPKRVRAIMQNKAPKHLDMLGNIELSEMASLGFCGSRNSTEKGLSIAQDCTTQAAGNNYSVVSGNASGIDFEAHYHCLKAGGKTILVLPEGIDHFRIKRALEPVWSWDRVLVISQFEANEPWRVFRAMSRNQLIVALSRVMIVIEAAKTGGTFNAGKEALKSGVPLFVAQHQDMSYNAQGNKLLLEMGARRLGKSKQTSRANLAEIIGMMEKEECFDRSAGESILL